MGSNPTGHPKFVERRYVPDKDTNMTEQTVESHEECKYLGNDAWDCGHIDNSEYCDCHVCVATRAEWGGMEWSD